MLRSVIPLLVAAVSVSTAAAAAAQESGASATRPAANYRLSPGDVIAIKIFPQPNLDRQCRVGKDGSIDFPLIRTVVVAGQTTLEAGTQLAELLNKDYLVNPQVTIDVVTYAKQNFVVMGQVQNAGTFSFPDEGRLTLVGAIAAAGGATRIADLSKVILQRADTPPIVVDLRPNTKNAQRIEILPNDVIYVNERMF